MVEQNAVGCMDFIGFTVDFHQPEGIEFCRGVRGTRVKRGLLGLRHLLDLPVKLGSGRLIKTGRNRVSFTASRSRRVPSASTSPVYSGILKGDPDMDCAARL